MRACMVLRPARACVCECVRGWRSSKREGMRITLKESGVDIEIYLPYLEKSMVKYVIAPRLRVSGTNLNLNFLDLWEMTFGDQNMLCAINEASSIFLKKKFFESLDEKIKINVLASIKLSIAVKIAASMSASPFSHCLQRKREKENDRQNVMQKSRPLV